MKYYPPDEHITAGVIAGVVCCLFPAKDFPRFLRMLAVRCSTYSRVEVRLYSLESTVIAQNPSGAFAQLSSLVDRPVPAGAPVFVSWPDATAGVDTAEATMGTEVR